MDMTNRRYELIENEDGHASESTVMQFDASSEPFRATYSGPNVVYGHVIVGNGSMLYHAMDKQGNLTAGRASVEVSAENMTLTWQWLTGDQSGGISKWRQLT